MQVPFASIGTMNQQKKGAGGAKAHGAECLKTHLCIMPDSRVTAVTAFAVTTIAVVALVLARRFAANRAAAAAARLTKVVGRPEAEEAIASEPPPSGPVAASQLPPPAARSPRPSEADPTPDAAGSVRDQLLESDITTGPALSLDAMLERQEGQADTLVSSDSIGTHISPAGTGSSRGGGAMAFRPRASMRTSMDRKMQNVAPFSPAIAHWELASRSASELLLPGVFEFETALLFVDISGFTTLCTRLDIDALQHHINAYFGELIDVITQYMATHRPSPSPNPDPGPGPTLTLLWRADRRHHPVGHSPIPTA